MNVLVQYSFRGRSASAIAEGIEGRIQEGRLLPGAHLPPVRRLARTLAVSPATIASAFRLLRARGLIVGQGRLGTRVTHRPPLLGPRPASPVPPHLRNLADGNPDRALLPRLRRVLGRLEDRPRLYGEQTHRQELLKLAARRLEADGIPGRHIAIVGGALDGIERVLQVHLRPGDSVAVEDPGYTGVLDLVASLGLAAVPVALDDEGPQPESLARALAAGAQACILTPRAQNPTGAAFSKVRVRALRALLNTHPDALVIEDDHAGPIAGAPALTVCRGRRARWAVVRSVSKSLGPDIRLAILAGDAATVAQVEARQAIGSGWVSQILQGLVLSLWSDARTEARLQTAAARYAERRRGLLAALSRRGMAAHGRSGLNVWVPVSDESEVVAQLARAGWAVRAGERYRLQSPPAIRITVATLASAEGERLAADLEHALRPERRIASA